MVRYGLCRLNGCGKSTLLTSIGMIELPIPDHMDVFHLTREIEASDMSSLEVAMNCDEERIKLEAEVECIAAHDAVCGEALYRIYERLDAMDASTAEKRAAETLNDLSSWLIMWLEHCGKPVIGANELIANTTSGKWPLE
ncbi:hypothetical protein L2E82_22835 [Cichorium intybus]|uniref:Uncharacterized protein n=1 Tax=Cichorium intybus TaxID=13427 RepID=A0ACB9DYM7_CICIN|nr:hypothetical protein L2E82_22835 [Cichorium intybus]